MSAQLDRLWAKGRTFLGSEYGILGGAMSWVSESSLVSALSNAGGFGVVACGSMSPALLDQEIQKVKTKTDRPFGVNIITMHPDIDALIDVCLDYKVSHIVLAGGLPKAANVARAKEGAKVICFAPALGLARKLVKLGADALVIEGMEAGGHIGPVSTSVLAQEILPHIQDIPVFVAGGIGHGSAIISYLEMGASGCQLGTRFVCAHESIAHPNFKKAFIKANARNAVPSVQLDPRFPVIPVRAIENKASQDFLQFQQTVINQHMAGDLPMKDAQLKIEHYWAGALRKAVIEGDIEGGSLMAGQSVGMVEKEQSIREIFDELLQQAEEALTHRKQIWTS